MTEEQFRKILKEHDDRLIGELSQFFDSRLQDVLGEVSKVSTRVNDVYTIMDGLAKRVETDDHERDAITHHQRRQDGWIGQLARATNTKLVPEQ
jgi:hypothetical protein